MGTHETPHIAQMVGTNLRRARLAKGLTQQQVGEMVGAKGGGRDVSRWENGGAEPGPKYRQPLANILFDGNLSALYHSPEQVLA